jgi:hypothetical protein
MSPKTTDPERHFGPCPKCAGSDLNVRFHEGARPHCWLCSIASCQYSEGTCGEKGRRGEHLAVHCRRCQFGWTERVS